MRRVLLGLLAAAAMTGICAPVAHAQDGTMGLDNGWLDYVGVGKKANETESEPPARRRSGPRARFAGLPAPQGTVWNYGRNRWVIYPGTGCAPAQQLRKGYCFGAVIAHLRQYPKEKSVVVVALSERAPLGTWISNETPVRYDYIEVFRQGTGFAAKQNRHGSAKVHVPLGCHFSPLKEGFVVAAPGQQGLREAALFRCP